MAITAAVIDVREPEWTKRLTFGGVPVSIAQLEYGDVLASTDDGELLIDSVPGKGSVFRIVLPAFRVRLRAPATPRTRSEPVI